MLWTSVRAGSIARLFPSISESLWFANALGAADLTAF